jgi:hypothetical protein
METKKTLDGGITQEQLDAWKAKYGIVHKIKITVAPDVYGAPDKDGVKPLVKPGDFAVGYIRDVNDDLELLSSVLSMQGGGKIVEAKVFLLNNAWLGGDIRCTTVNKVMISAATQAATTVDIADGSVEKL